MICASAPSEILAIIALKNREKTFARTLAHGSHFFNFAKPAVRLGLGQIDFAAVLGRVEELLKAN